MRAQWHEVAGFGECGCGVSDLEVAFGFADREYERENWHQTGESPSEKIKPGL